MANRSSKLECPEPPFSGWVATGAASTWSSASRVIAARAIALWPRCGGSKVPPKKAMRIGASYRDLRCSRLYPRATSMAIAYIALGSNLDSAFGNRTQTLCAACDRLGRIGRVLARSSLYETEPVGFLDHGPFLNAVLALETELEPLPLLRALLVIERELGRDRSQGASKGPRTLDLDLL